MNRSNAKAGSLLQIEHGEYSDYTVDGFFLVLKDFSPAAEIDMYLDAHPDQKEQYSFKRDAFLAAVLAKGLLLEIEHGTLHLGSYSSIDDGNYCPLAGLEKP